MRFECLTAAEKSAVVFSGHEGISRDEAAAGGVARLKPGLYEGIILVGSVGGRHRLSEVCVKGKAVGQRQTAQREAIYRVIRRAKGPLTVEQIHQRAKRASPRMGIATVYRAIKLLMEADEILPVVLPDGQTRYEAADLGHHHHFRCRSCNQVYDMAYCPLSIPKGTTFPGGFRVEDHELTLYGICPNCARDEEESG